MSELDDAYSDRARMLAVAARLAMAAGMRCGLAQDPRERNPDYENVVFLELEGVGQVSYHVHVRDLMLFAFLPPYEGTWDGHGIVEKNRRCEVFSKTFSGRRNFSPT